MRALKTNKSKKSEKKKIQNEHCLSGQQTNVFAKKLKKLEKQIKSERREKIQNEQAWIGCQPSLVRKKRRKKKKKKKNMY